ncbi:MAG: T9SS type A sorting domain-containing protein [Salibacteraceae bacterium]
MDTNAVNPLDSMIAYLTDWGSLETQEMLVPLYWEKQDFTNAQHSIDELAQTETHDKLAELLQKINDRLDANEEITEFLNDTTFMDSLATDSTIIGEAWAQTGLFVLQNKSFPLVVGDTIVGGPRGSSESETDVEESKINSDIQVYPNPNSGVFTLKWANTNLSFVKLFDLSGKEAFVTEIGQQGSAQIVLPSNLVGLFQLILFDKDGNSIYSQKILVND